MKEKYVKDEPIASRLYDKITEFVESYEALESVDYSIVNAAAYAYAQFVKLQVEITERGAVHVTKTGYTQVNGYFTAGQKYWNQYLDAVKHLGLSPLARSKMESTFDKTAKDYKQDPIAQMLKNSKRDEADA